MLDGLMMLCVGVALGSGVGVVERARALRELVRQMASALAAQQAVIDATEEDWGDEDEDGDDEPPPMQSVGEVLGEMARERAQKARLN